MAAFAHPVPESYRTESQPSNHRPLAKLLCYRSLCCDLGVSTGGSVRNVAASLTLNPKGPNPDPAHSSIVAPFTKQKAEKTTAKDTKNQRLTHKSECPDT